MQLKAVPIVTLIVLVAFSIITARSEFKCYGDDALTEKLSVSTKSAETKPASPSESTNERKNVAEFDSMTEAKTIPQPYAVPVLTLEEAVKANNEAFSFHRKKAKEEMRQAFSQTFDKISNGIHSFFEHTRIGNIIIALLPLLFTIDALFFRRKGSKKTSSRIMEWFSLSRRMRIIYSVSLLAFGLLVFVPWSVYFGNSLQFPFIFSDFVNWNLRKLGLSIIGASIVLLLIPPVVSDYLVAAIAGLGLCVYAQAMFMNQHLGTMNGVEPEWNEHRVFGTINLIVWIVIFLAPVVLRKMTPTLFSKIISTTTGIVLFLEILATASIVFAADQKVWLRTDTYFIDGSKQFQLSKKKNVVVIVMDALGSEFVKACFESYPETKSVVKDFTWYIDARSNYDGTFPGLLNELTGAYLHVPSNNFYEMIEKMWHSSSAKSFYKQMKDAGYEARLYFSVGQTLIGPESYFHNYFSNVEANDVTYQIDYDRLHFCLKQMSGFSFAPYFFKKNFFYTFSFADNVVQKQVADVPSDKIKIPAKNSDFLKKMISSGISSDADKSILSFHYVIGAHRPYRFDEIGNDVEVPFDNPLPTTKGCFYLLSTFINLLKESGIYDNTAILVCSDHGGNDKISKPYDMSFMVKPFHANKAELTIDESKVQSIDVIPTLLKMACGDNADLKDFDGYPSFNIPNERVRKVFRTVSVKEWPSPDSDLAKVYPGRNGYEEYIFNDIESFKFGTNSQSFVRQIPLVHFHNW